MSCSELSSTFVKSSFSRAEVYPVAEIFSVVDNVLFKRIKRGMSSDNRWFPLLFYCSNFSNRWSDFSVLCACTLERKKNGICVVRDIYEMRKTYTLQWK